MKMMICMNAEGRAFQDDDGNLAPEVPVAEILEDLAAQLRSGTKMVDLHCDKLRARYAGASAAPGMPEYIAESLSEIELSSTYERENLNAIDKAIKGPTMRFELGDGHGYCELNLIFEVLCSDAEQGDA